jgi:SAM-dependent methyltransferase
MITRMSRRLTTATSERFGYGWSQASPRALTAPVAYHLHTMRAALGAPAFAGTILDAGCGEGVDLGSVVLSDHCAAVGVELSAGGVRTTRARIDGIAGARLVQGDVLALPFGDATFDGAYSYGVVHHTIDPAGAVREIARTLKPGAPLLLYVYEDFSRRPLTWRIALASVNAARGLVWRLPPRGIRAVCWMLAPFVYACCTWPSKHFEWAARFPYPARQNPSMRSLIPDLYDRFAAPIEKRYSERGAAELAEQAGLVVRRTAQERGWMVWAERPSAAHTASA